MIFEHVANMSRDEIESHPLMNANCQVKEYISGYIEVENDVVTDDYFTLFIVLMSMQVYFSEKDGDNITELLDTMKQNLDNLLKYVDVCKYTLYILGEIVELTTLKFIIEYFWNTSYRNDIINGLLDLDATYNAEREVLDGILRYYYDDIDLIVFIAKHENWRSMFSSIETAIEKNNLLKIVFVMEDIKHIVDEFNLPPVDSSYLSMIKE